MRLKTTHICAVSLLLVLFGSALAQQTVDESKIDQMRATIQKLEGLSGDTNIPVDTRQHLSELLFEKRGELHALLRQKREALRAILQSTTSATERTSLNETIQQLSREMQQLSGASTTASVPAESGPTHPSGNGNVETVSPSSVSAAAATPTAASPAPTSANVSSSLTSSATSTSSPAVAQPAAAQPAPVAAQPAAGPQDDPCTGLRAGPSAFNDEYQRQIHNVACSILKARKGEAGVSPSDATITFQRYNFVMALAIARAKLPEVAIPELTAQAENASHAKNVSGVESSSGSTSLTSKAGLPAIFGFAVEHGGLTKTTSGTTVTFTGNPVGLIEAMAKKGFITSYQTQDDFTAFLRKLSFGLSFDTSRGTQPGIFTADKQQLSGYSFKFKAVDQRDPRDKRYTDRWLALTNKQATKLATSLNRFVDDIANGRMPNINAWVTSANTALAGATTLDQIKATLTSELDRLAQLELTPDQQALVKEVGTDFSDYLKERNDILDEISNGWIATFDYNNERPVTGPSLSNFRFLAEKGAYNGSIDFTGNASLTIYNSRPTTPNAQRLRDFRFSGQIDVPIGDVSRTGKWLLSFAGRYERLLKDEPIPGTTTVIKKGDIAAGQLKLTIPIRGTALKFPLSITFANRTELIQEKEVRGNFGITFDLDSILAKFNPFNNP